jgi:hypothetical protein
MLPKSINDLYSKSNRPFYDELQRTWKVNIPGWGVEGGELLYVIGEYTRSGLWYPFTKAESAERGYQHHEHTFTGVVEALLSDPSDFSVAGFEEFYSKQELNLLEKLQTKLLEERSAESQPSDAKETVPVQRFKIYRFFGADPVSRSQARKLCSNIIVPGKVILDFSGVGWIGQGFAHQLFVVFQREHPDNRLFTINAAKSVETMIRHVLNTSLFSD